MSIKIMSAIFDSRTLGPTERLIMLSLADHADDQGRCYPSISRLCERTGLSERAVQSNIKALTAAGHLVVQANAGPSGCNVYFVRPTPAADAPPQEMHPRSKCTTPPQQVRPTPAADAPKPSRTIIEPSEIREALVPLLGEELADGFIAHRKALKAPLTPHASRLLAKKLAECADPKAEAERSIVNGWKSVFPAPPLKAITGGRNDRAQFAVAHREYTRRIAAGEVNRGPDPSDPFAGR
jgi:hypothetical protein